MRLLTVAVQPRKSPGADSPAEYRLSHHRAAGASIAQAIGGLHADITAPALPHRSAALDTVHRAAAPLPPNDRGGFLQMVAELLRDEAVIGDGIVARAAATAQAHFLHPPAIGEMRHVGKYAKVR
jgi:hypothetical protein